MDRIITITTGKDKGEEGRGVGELACRLRRDVKRVHEDATALVELGLTEPPES